MDFVKKQLQNIVNDEEYVQYAIYGAIIVVVFLFTFILINKLSKKNRNNLKMKNNLDNIKTYITSTSSKQAQNPLRDYYVCSSYNSCCGGDFKNDFVDLTPLMQVIKNGARMLDFEIYSVNNEPVVSASSVKNFNYKEMYNAIPFVDVMDAIQRVAFSSASCPNPNDPLFINLRIKSNNLKIYQPMASSIENSFGRKLLEKEYHYESGRENLFRVPLHYFLGKVVVICDQKDSNFKNVKEFHKYVNVSSSSIFLRELRFYNVVYTPDYNELMYFNKKNASIVTPDLNDKSINFDPKPVFKYGCQFCCMTFQSVDEGLLYYLDLFNDNKSAFILKPEQLRYKPVTIDKPKKQNPALSYAPRQIKMPYFSGMI